MIAGKQPTERDGFTGLHAPKWPAETLRPAQSPSSPSAAPSSTPRSVSTATCRPKAARRSGTTSTGRQPNGGGQRYLILNEIPVEEVGTDRTYLDSLANRTVKLPPNVVLESDKFADALKEVVEKAVTLWYDKQSISPDKRKEMDGYRENEVRAEMVYKARPLDGVWATPPYLHNGSVPTIEALLGPAQRPAEDVLARPSRIRSGAAGLPVRRQAAGRVRVRHLAARQPQHRPRVRRSLRQERAAGRAVVGRRLRPDERAALIEFLKSM